MSIGSLVVSLQADIAQFTSSMDKASALAEQRMQQIDKSLGIVKTSLTALGAGAAAGLTLDKIKEKILGVIEASAGMAEMSARTGVAVEQLSGLASVAKLSNTDTDSLATGMQKLAKSMIDAQNGGTKTTAAFNAIGLSVNDLKGKNPADVFQLMAEKASHYQDGAEKLVVAQNLLGKAGANLLPMMKDLAEVGELQVRLTTEQAEQAKQLEMDWKRLQLASDAVWKSLALALVPTMDDFVRQLVQTQKESKGVKGAIDDLANDHTIRDWAQNAAIALAVLIESMQGVMKTARAIGGSFQAVFADVQLIGKYANPATGSALLAKDVVTGEFSKRLADRNKVVEDANKRYVELWNFDGTKLSSGLEKRFALSNLASDYGISGADQDSENRRHGIGERPKIDGSGLGNANKGPKDDPARAFMEGQIKAGDALIASEKKQLATRESYLQEFYQQQYMSADEYYSTQRQMIQDELQQELKVYASEMVAARNYLAVADTETKKQEARNKIAEVAAKQTAAEIDASGRLTKSVMDQMKLYRDFELQTKSLVYQWGLQNTASQFQIDLMGKSTLAVQRLTAARAIDLQAEQQIHQAQEKGLQGEELQKRTAELVADGETQKAAAIELVNRAYAKQTDAAFGAHEAYRKYAEDAANMGAQIESATTNAFKGMEDALVSFATTGKLNFKSLVDSIIADVARMVIRAQITGPLAKMLSGGGSSFGAGSSYMDGPFGGGGGGGGFLGAAMSAIGSYFGGKFADGGDPAVGRISMVGERGPEAFVPRTAGTIIPNDFLKGSGSGDMKFTIVNNTSSPIGRVTERRISDTERALIVEETAGTVAAHLYEPNSKMSKGLVHNYGLRRTR